MAGSDLIDAICKIIQPEIFTQDRVLSDDHDEIFLSQLRSATREKAQQIIALIEGHLD